MTSLTSDTELKALLDEFVLFRDSNPESNEPTELSVFLRQCDFPDAIDRLHTELQAHIEQKVAEANKNARKEAYSLGFETAKKTYTYKMIPVSKVNNIYKEIAVAYQQTTGEEKCLFTDWLNDKVLEPELKEGTK